MDMEEEKTSIADNGALVMALTALVQKKRRA